MPTTTKSTRFVASKDEWHTKKDTGKSMKKCIVCTVVCQKAPLGRKSDIEQQNYQARIPRVTS